MSQKIEVPCLAKTIALVYETFRGVTRDRGVSWYESSVIDDYGSEEECAAARLEDQDATWEQLVDDSEWDHHPGSGGLGFVDAIGFRYYIAPAMIRDLQRVETALGPIHFYLTSDELSLDQWSILTSEEKQCICEVLKCLIAVTLAENFDDLPNFKWRGWEMAYRSYWMSIDQTPLREEQFG